MAKQAAKKRIPPALRAAWELLTSLIAIASIAFAVYCCIGILNQKNTGELFFPFGYRPAIILSGSMEETLQTGAVVIVQETKDVSEGDVVLFIARDGTHVIHRYVNTDPDGNMITMGDANPKEDFDPVTADQLQGKVVVVLNWVSGPLRSILGISPSIVTIGS